MMPYQKFSALPLTLSLLVVAAATLAGCSKPADPPEPLRAVKVVTVGTSAALSGYEFSGEVRPRVESRLGFRVAGKIIRRQAELGQHVKAGDVLAQLDARDYQLATEAARAQMRAAQTNRDLAAADFKRYATLREQNFISGAELERRDTTLKAAQAQLQQAQAQLASQGNQARYTSLVADVSGVVTAIEAEPGQVVSAGSPVVRIAQDGARDVVFSVPEDKIPGVRPGAAVTVKPWASGTSVPGKVREVAASADPVTRTYAVKVSLDPAVQPPLGATVSVLPALNRPDLAAQVIKLPTSALRQEGKGTAVWLVDRGSMTLKSQAVEVTSADGNEAVVSAGLQPGMTVVSAGVHVLQPGQKVAIWQDPAAVRPGPVEGRAGAATSSARTALPGTAQAATVPVAKR